MYSFVNVGGRTDECRQRRAEAMDAVPGSARLRAAFARGAGDHYRDARLYNWAMRHRMWMRTSAAPDADGLQRAATRAAAWSSMAADGDQRRGGPQRAQARRARLQDRRFDITCIIGRCMVATAKSSSLRPPPGQRPTRPCIIGHTGPTSIVTRASAVASTDTGAHPRSPDHAETQYIPAMTVRRKEPSGPVAVR